MVSSMSPFHVIFLNEESKHLQGKTIQHHTVKGKKEEHKAWFPGLCLKVITNEVSGLSFTQSTVEQKQKQNS